LVIWLFGSQLSEQLSNLAVLLPTSWKALQSDLSSNPAGAILVAQIQQAIDGADGHLLALGARFLGGAAPLAAGAVIVACASAYLAFHPRTYLGGALLLVPPKARARAEEVVGACRVALDQWLFGQLISMVFVAATISIGMWIAGVPSPLALGLLAGLGQLVPVVGPWCAAIPAMIIAFASGPQALGGAVVVYVSVTQIESNVLTPLILRHVSKVPMAVTLFAVIGMGALLGPLGVLLATPLTVCGYVLVRELYLRDALRERLLPAPDEAALATGR
jgi:predicted PurR-regulated permease PerM